MATGKRYYWIKLKESFMTSDTIDYFMEQPDGANYVVLYQLLCLKTINTGGRLSRQIGEITIPYDVAKIQRDCKWFSADTIRVANSKSSRQPWKRHGSGWKCCGSNMTISSGRWRRPATNPPT